MEKFSGRRPLVTQRHLRGEKRKQRERESDAGIGWGRRAGGGTVFTFDSNSQLTQLIIIRFANETVTYYQFAKSYNVREKETIGENAVKVDPLSIVFVSASPPMNPMRVSLLRYMVAFPVLPACPGALKSERPPLPR